MVQATASQQKVHKTMVTIFVRHVNILNKDWHVII